MRAGRRGAVPDPHRLDASFEDTAKCSVIVANEIFRSAVPGKRLGDLPRQPLRRRISGHRGPHQPPPSVAKNKKCIELLKGNRRDMHDFQQRSSTAQFLAQIHFEQGQAGVLIEHCRKAWITCRMVLHDENRITCAGVATIFGGFHGKEG